MFDTCLLDTFFWACLVLIVSYVAKCNIYTFNYSLPSSIEVKDECSYITVPLYAFAVCWGQTYLLFFVSFWSVGIMMLVLPHTKRVIDCQTLGYRFVV